jgi:acyl dehydratase
MTKNYSLTELAELVGQEILVTDWMLITQERIQMFADATGDHQWIHVDVERCRRESPFKAPIAHGFLTLSLISGLMGTLGMPTDAKASLNYGLNKVRFPSPVPVNSRLRARFTLQSLETLPNCMQSVWEVTMEIEGSDKPVCVAEFVGRHFT